MAKIQFLTILLAVTCFLGGVVSLTDKELEVCDVFNTIPVLKLLNTMLHLVRAVRTLFYVLIFHLTLNLLIFQERFNRMDHQLQQLKDENQVSIM